MDFEEARIELAPNLVIERLTSDEIIDALEVGLLPLTFPTVPFFHADEGGTFALKKMSYLPRVVEPSDQPSGEEN